MQAWLRDVVFERFQAVLGAAVGALVGAAAWPLASGVVGASAPWLVPAAVAGLAASQAWAFPRAARRAHAPGGAGRLARLYRDLGFAAGVVAAAWGLGAGLRALLGGAAALPPAAGIAACGGLVAMLAWGHALRPRPVRETRHRVAVRGLPADLRGLRIAHVSDLHLGNGTSPARVARLVARVNARAPDLIVVTGDLFDGPTDRLAEGARALGGLRAPLGVYGVLGNHDVELGRERVAAALRENAPGLRLLRGDWSWIDAPGGGLAMAGVDDPGRDWTRGGGGLPALEALAARRPPGAPAILLVHRPDAFPQAARLGFDLVLSGHFHGGQIAVPGTGGRLSPAGLLTPFCRGLHRREGATLFVSRGIGFAGPRIRLGSPPEVPLLHLEPEAAAAPAGAQGL